MFPQSTQNSQVQIQPKKEKKNLLLHILSNNINNNYKNNEGRI